MINSFLQIMGLCGFVLGIMACSILWFSNKSHRHANHLLTLSLFGLAIAMLVTFLSEWNIKYYAYIYRFPGPLYYLIMPCAYLYVRAVINDETNLRKWDFVHFLPATLRFLELIPFYLTSYEYRRKLVEQLAKDPDNPIKLSEGILPPFYHTIFMAALGVIYLGLMMHSIKKGKGIKEASFHISHSTSFRWLQTFTALIALIAIPIIIIIAFSQPLNINRSQLLLSTVSVCFLVINLYLFFQPEILYGIPRTKLNRNNAPLDVKETPEEMNHKDEQEEQEHDTLLPEEGNEVHSALAYLEGYKPVLELYIATARPFLKKSYTIVDLARETGIPQHHLSALLNRVYQMRFNEFMNRMRIDYITENFGIPEWESLTLEGIAKEAGFNSRTTFFNSIKKNTGLAPSEFVENIKTLQALTKVRKK